MTIANGVPPKQFIPTQKQTETISPPYQDKPFKGDPQATGENPNASL